MRWTLVVLASHYSSTQQLLSECPSKSVPVAVAARATTRSSLQNMWSTAPTVSTCACSFFPSVLAEHYVLGSLGNSPQHTTLQQFAAPHTTAALVSAVWHDMTVATKNLVRKFFCIPQFPWSSRYMYSRCLSMFARWMLWASASVNSSERVVRWSP